ncbi:hypothetical protein P0W64_15035 [Tsukamurella sp. 8F]|uniref:hypothetical protein n=1 Tax=Tsukamurella sp. 8F TaxID=3031961 RepID=UPI0023BA2310|nr:hypothetical protein [Tsukamurella sp. 8F]MDF0588092.1 hypothetical protein [Tsukamurella sp. 8F]
MSAPTVDRTDTVADVLVDAYCNARPRPCRDAFAARMRRVLDLLLDGHTDAAADLASRPFDTRRTP